MSARAGLASCGEIVRVALELSVHQRIGFGRSSRQGLRPHLRRGRRCLLRARSAAWVGPSPRAGRLRNAGDHQPRRDRRRDPRAVRDHPRLHRPHRPPGGEGHRLRAGRLPLGEGGDRGASARPVDRHRPGRRLRRQQGRGRRRPGHHVRLCLPRDPGADAGADLLCPPHSQGHVAGATLRRIPGARARRQEPGDDPLRERQAGRGHPDRGLDPALRREPVVPRHPGDRRALCAQGPAGGLDHQADGVARQSRPASS